MLRLVYQEREPELLFPEAVQMLVAHPADGLLQARIIVRKAGTSMRPIRAVLLSQTREGQHTHYFPLTYSLFDTVEEADVWLANQVHQEIDRAKKAHPQAKEAVVQ